MANGGEKRDIPHDSSECFAVFALANSVGLRDGQIQPADV
jgi:hypothetical protein